MSLNQPLQGVRIGIDVGGTFTDFVLFNPAGDRFFYHKQPSVPRDPALAVSQGLCELLSQSRLQARDVALLLHGTTLGLNAIIQRQGAPIALVVSRGFRDVLEIGRARMPSSFDFHAGREPPFLPRDRVLEISARFNPAGEVTDWPGEPELDALAGQIRGLNVSAVALMLINGYANPQQEQRLADILRRKLHDADINILSAAALWPEIREYERTLVAGLNAYIQPLMSRYFTRLASLIEELGIAAPLLVSASNGGVLPLDSALSRPVDTLLSGPASGVTAALQLAADCGAGDIISFDMGGTSSDIAIAQGGEAEMVTRTEIGGLPLVLPVVGVSAIGAGGGSIVSVDDYGVLKVGPLSAGADPGPAAYGRGGTQATLTDGYLACGIVDAASFLGGAMPLSAEKARAALATVAARLEFSAEDAVARAASGALAVATAQMAAEMLKALAQRGLEPAALTLVPFGGAGPTHANFLAQEAGIRRILIPPRPGTFCAQGAATASLRRDFVRSLRVKVSANSLPQINATLRQLVTQAEQWFNASARHLTNTVRLNIAADMRYAGQAYELKIALADTQAAALGSLTVEELTVEQLRQAFHLRHQRSYGFRDDGAEIDLTTLRLSLIGQLPALPATAADAGDGPAVYHRRPVFLQQRWLSARVYQRAALRPGDRFSGPAIVEQEDTTVLVLPHWEATADRLGNLHLSRLAEQEEPAV
ncbi:hydantoinase/oxoprolinase family protein [Brenneria corticis]|uniref:Hydantoinase n=1 Tax=Brenneria corticis TaxID=2173106 RepID=A0A2U1TK07_9GAMM|nr:hydantoinase/oxoprolinase family protein [Brenneria sp. CFCC 11842]PWC09662.1 hydantoinase [Brenneria sp. CFCC 11842]